MKARWMMIPLLLLVCAACPAEVGQPCDGFFANGCNAPASCVEGPHGSFCAMSCQTRPGTEPGPRHYCSKPEFEAVEVSVDTPVGAAPMGCMCMPKVSS